MKVYVLKAWYTNKVYKDQGDWINEKVTLSEREAEMWIESPFRQMADEGPDPNHDYDVLDLECPDYDIDDMVEKKANEWAEEEKGTEPDFLRKQIVKDFTKGFNLAKAIYCKEEEK